jgi:hypothetical protein
LSSVGKKCRFCDCRNAKATCDWPITRRGDVLIEDLRVGDLWIAQTSEQRGTIVEIEDFDLTRRDFNLRRPRTPALRPVPRRPAIE